MQLLYFNSDDHSARKMHAEFLSYKGYQWDLKHFKCASQLADELTDNAFDAVLFEAETESFRYPETFEKIVALADPKPVIALMRESPDADHVMSPSDIYDLQMKLIGQGFHDVVGASSLLGAIVMRHLRLAQSRIQNYVYQPNEGHQTLLAKLDLAAALQDKSGSDASGVFLMPEKPQKEPSDTDRIRILNVETEVQFDDMGHSLKGAVDAPEITTVNRLSEAEEILEDSDEFDIVIVEQGAIENQEIERHKGLRNRMREMPFIIGLIDRSDFSAVACLEKGFADAFVMSRSSPEEIMLCVRKTLARNERALQASQQSDLKPANDRRQTTRDGRNRRRADRFLIERPVTAICVMPDGSPDRNNAFHAQTVDFSLGGIGFKIPLLDRLPSRNWMVGVHCDDGEVRCANVLLRHVTYDSDGITIGSMFRPPSEDLLDPSMLASRIEPETCRVVYGMSRTALERWAELGMLSKSIAQRIKSCPECDAVSTVGDGCTECGSARLEYKMLVHHFACAYVDDIEAFQTDAGISCPKCLTSDLVVGADFEVIKSQYFCQTCDHSGNETAMVGSCFNCRLRYPLKVAHELEVYRYDVQRLDILDFLGSTK